MSRRFSSKARKAEARSAPRPREPHNDGEPVGHFAKVTVRQCAIEAPQVKNGAQALPHNGGVTVRQWATEAPQMKNGAQALPHNDGVTVRQWAIEAPQVKVGAQALDFGFPGPEAAEHCKAVERMTKRWSAFGASRV